MKSSFSAIYANGDIGGIVGQNKGTITTSSSYAKIIYYYVKDNARSIGGIVGYNYGGTVTIVNQYGHIQNAELKNRPIDLYANMGTIIGHNKGSFDGQGFGGSRDVNYTYHDGIFGIGKYDHSDYMFKHNGARVGKI